MLNYLQWFKSDIFLCLIITVDSLFLIDLIWERKINKKLWELTLMFTVLPAIVCVILLVEHKLFLPMLKRTDFCLGCILASVLKMIMNITEMIKGGKKNDTKQISKRV